MTNSATAPADGDPARRWASALAPLLRPADASMLGALARAVHGDISAESLLNYIDESPPGERDEVLAGMSASVVVHVLAAWDDRAAAFRAASRQATFERLCRVGAVLRDVRDVERRARTARQRASA